MDPVVFYPRKHGVLVTSALFCAPGRRLPIRKVINVRYGYGSTQAARRTALEIIAIEALLMVAVVAIGVAIDEFSWIALPVGLAHLLVSATLGWLSVVHWPTPLQLWADVDEGPTLLYSSTDSVEFHRICRALRRAIELNRELSY